MKYTENENKYIKAQKKVDRLRAFYTHVLAYVIINTVITILKISRNLNNGETLEVAFYDFGTYAVWWLWGIGLAIHAFAVFGLDKVLGNDWESKKIQKFMDNEKLNK